MNDDTPQLDSERLRELAKLRVVLTVPGMQDIRVQRDIPYKPCSDGNLGIDVYQPARPGDALPAVIFVVGYSDKGALDLFGFRLKEWGCYVSWGQLVAASGLVGINCSSFTPATDAKDALNFVREHAADLRVDPDRIGICAFSGNGPTALSLLMAPATRLRFAVMCNTYMLDLDGDTTVADMAAKFGFAAPNSGKFVCDLDQNVPMFLVRSGRDEVPGLNQSLDRFAEQALESNLLLRLVNLPHAPHGFDTLHDTEESRTTIQEILTFMRANSETQR